MLVAIKSRRLENVPDEDLVRLFKQAANLAARNELLLRYLDEVGRMIAYQARAGRLLEQDVEDTQQTAVFWMIEAIAHYDVQQRKPHRCRFRTFLHMVINRRIIDLARRRRESAGSLDRLHVEVAEENSQQPVCCAQRDEAYASLKKAVDELDEDSRELCDELLSGGTLRAASRSMGRSYDAVKRLHRRVISALRRSLSGYDDHRNGGES